jgi:type I restriction enzyme S subunit
VNNNQVAEASATAMDGGSAGKAGALSGQRDGVSAIPEGYKQTEVGVIPEDWEVVQVQDVCGFIVPGRNKPRCFDGDIPWITTPDLDDGRVVHSSKSSLKVSLSEAKFVGSKVVPTDSVIMSCVGELGIVAIAGCRIVINQQLHAFLPSVRISSVFLAYALKRQESYFYSVATKTALPYLNKDNCNATPIPFPPLKEQTAIANALSDVDALINELEKLISKKQAIKTATMQQLLTGRTRLPQFAHHEDGSLKGYKPSELGDVPEDWEVDVMANVLDRCSSGATPYRGNVSFYKGKNRWITSDDHKNTPSSKIARPF